MRASEMPVTQLSFGQYVTVMQQPIEHSADRCNIADQLAPVLNWAVRCKQCAEAFVAVFEAGSSLKMNEWYTDRI
jgi:hypothetical protein